MLAKVWLRSLQGYTQRRSDAARADLERAATAILRAGVAQTGQACQSVERVYVDQTIYEQFVKLLVEKASKVKLNYPEIGEGHIGPLIFEPQAATIR